MVPCNPCMEGRSAASHHATLGPEELSRIAIAQGHGNNPLDEVCLFTGIRFTRFASGRGKLSGQVLLEVFVLTSRGGVIAEIIAKGQCPPFLGTASFDDVNVVTVRPLGRPMEEWTERVVRMRNVNVSYGLKPFAVRRNWLKRGD